MKNILLSLLIISALGCSSNKTKTSEDKSNMEVGVQNANGNIPDTTNAINLGSQKKDSSVVKDSLKK